MLMVLHNCFWIGAGLSLLVALPSRAAPIPLCEGSTTQAERDLNENLRTGGGKDRKARIKLLESHLARCYYSPWQRVLVYSYIEHRDIRGAKKGMEIYKKCPHVEPSEDWKRNLGDLKLALGALEARDRNSGEQLEMLSGDEVLDYCGGYPLRRTAEEKPSSLPASESLSSGPGGIPVATGHDIGSVPYAQPDTPRSVPKSRPPKVPAKESLAWWQRWKVWTTALGVGGVIVGVGIGGAVLQGKDQGTKSELNCSDCSDGVFRF